MARRYGFRGKKSICLSCLRKVRGISLQGNRFIGKYGAQGLIMLLKTA